MFPFLLLYRMFSTVERSLPAGVLCHQVIFNDILAPRYHPGLALQPLHLHVSLSETYREAEVATKGSERGKHKGHVWTRSFMLRCPRWARRLQSASRKVECQLQGMSPGVRCQVEQRLIVE